MEIEASTDIGRLRTAVQAIASAFELDATMVVVLDRDLRLLHASPRCAEILGTRPEGWLGRSVRDLLSVGSASKEDIDELEAACAIAGRDRPSTFLHCDHPVEGRLILEGRVYRIGVDGHDCFLVVYHDVTPQAREVGELAERETRYRTIASASRSIVTETSGAGLFTYLNPACEEVLGYEPGELEGTSPLNLHHELDRPAFVGDLLAESKIGEPITVRRHRLRHRDGSWMWFEATAIRYARSDGEIRTIGVAVEISARIKAEQANRDLEEQLLRSQKLESLGVLAGGIAHDFNNKLGIMLLGLDTLLLEQAKESERGSDFRTDLLKVRQGVLQSSALAKKLLLFGKHAPRKMEPVLINLQIEEGGKMLSRVLGEEVRTVLDLQEDLWCIRGDAVTIDQIVTNLAINGRDAMPDGGSLVIETRNVTLTSDGRGVQSEAREGRFVRVRVRDTGDGMEKSVQARIYDPFFTTKNTEQNSGLGLSIVHRAVHAHGGWIELKSAPGEGATFDIYLPALSDEIVARSIARSPSSEVRRQASERILVLEDEDGLRESIQDVLERQGYCVEACEDLASARSAFREASFDLILTDVRLPDGRGTKLVADALARDPNVGCILMSGYTQNEEDSEVLPFSRTSFLHKPFSLDDLLDSVRKQLDRR